MIRKTMSVATLGVIPFRSKRERIRRAEAEVNHAKALLEEEHVARSAAEARVKMAEQELHRTELQALKMSAEAAKVKARRKDEKRKQREHRVEGVTKAMREAVEPAASAMVEQGRTARRAAKKQAKKARKAAKRQARKLRARVA